MSDFAEDRFLGYSRISNRTTSVTFLQVFSLVFQMSWFINTLVLSATCIVHWLHTHTLYSSVWKLKSTSTSFMTSLGKKFSQKVSAQLAKLIIRIYLNIYIIHENISFTRNRNLHSKRKYIYF